MFNVGQKVTAKIPNRKMNCYVPIGAEILEYLGRTPHWARGIGPEARNQDWYRCLLANGEKRDIRGLLLD